MPSLLLFLMVFFFLLPCLHHLRSQRRCFGLRSELTSGETPGTHISLCHIPPLKCARKSSEGILLIIHLHGEFVRKCSFKRFITLLIHLLGCKFWLSFCSKSFFGKIVISLVCILHLSIILKMSSAYQLLA